MLLPERASWVRHHQGLKLFSHNLNYFPASSPCQIPLQQRLFSGLRWTVDLQSRLREFSFMKGSQGCYKLNYTNSKHPTEGLWSHNEDYWNWGHCLVPSVGQRENESFCVCRVWFVCVVCCLSGRWKQSVDHVGVSAFPSRTITLTRLEKWVIAVDWTVWDSLNGSVWFKPWRLHNMSLAQT